MGIKKDRLQRRQIKNWELSRRILGALKKSPYLPRPSIWSAQTVLHSFPRQSSPVQSHRFCIFTGKSKSVKRRYKLSRMAFRKVSVVLPGIRKW